MNEALETLATVTDSRWRLLYFVAGDKATLKGGESAWFSGQKPTDWKMISFPMGKPGDPWTMAPTPPRPIPGPISGIPKTAAPAPVQTFFAEAAQLTNAGFAFPADWNPTVTAAPAFGGD